MSVIKERFTEQQNLKEECYNMRVYDRGWRKDNVNQYMDILKDNLLFSLEESGISLDNAIFQWDNDSKHTSKKWLKDNNIIILEASIVSGPQPHWTPLASYQKGTLFHTGQRSLIDLRECDGSMDNIDLDMY